MEHLQRRMDRKLNHWENQLLDLGKRNRMIAYREGGRSSLALREPDFHALYERLILREETLTFQRPVTEDVDARVWSMTRLLETLALPVEVRLGDIRADGIPEEIDRTLQNLRSRSRLAIEEQGANILYLIFGFIEWREKGSGETLRSPLLLAPVTISRQNLRAPWNLRRYDDEIVVNPTLAHLFARDYGVTLPSFDHDEDSLAHFLEKMDALAETRGWRILRQCSVGLVSFQKISMYKDLLLHEAEVRSHPILRAFAGERLLSPLMAFDHDGIPAAENFQVVAADSSQQDAIALSRQGVSFVLQGPPGTGKSQTITNIISEALADGKKVLFVSEKMAALEVVHKRLAEAELGDFCLPLHSSRTGKREVLTELGRCLELSKTEVSDRELSCLTALDLTRESLQPYVEELHRPMGPGGLTAYEVIGRLEMLADLPEVRIEPEQPEAVTRETLERLALRIADYDAACRSLGPDWQRSPWHGLLPDSLSPGEKQRLRSDLASAAGVLRSCTLPAVVTAENLGLYCSLFTHGAACGGSPRDWFSRDTAAEEAFGLRMQIAHRELEQRRAALLANYTPACLDLDGRALLDNLLEHRAALGELPKDFRNHRRRLTEQLMTNRKQAEQAALRLEQLRRTDLPQEELLREAEKVLHHSEILEEWAQNLRNIAEIEEEYRRLSDRKLALQRQISADWEASVFCLDWAGMLSRFKADYTGFSKHFKKTYRADLRSLRLAHRQVGKTFGDDEVIALLHLLKSCQELEEGRQRCRSRQAALCRDPSVLLKRAAAVCKQEAAREEQRLCEEIANLSGIIAGCDALSIHAYGPRRDALLVSDLENLAAYQSLDRSCRREMESAAVPADTDWDAYVTALHHAGEVRNILKTGQIDGETAALLRSRGREREIAQYAAALQDAFRANAALTAVLAHFEPARKNVPLSETALWLADCLSRFGDLERWFDFREIRKLCEDEGLGSFLRACASVDCPAGRLDDVFRKAFYRSWLEWMSRELPAVARFRTQERETRIVSFCGLDDRQQTIARRRIRQRLLDGMPTMEEPGHYADELAVLRHELGKRRRFLPIRRLFREMPNLLQRLKPCLMMSPLTVSQFLDGVRFDLVIFDEASQIFPEDAIGAICRGSQVILAGDSKQLPPTNFFTAGIGGDADWDEGEALPGGDSILEEAQNCLPNRSLRWHYRSRSEDLIAFSNREIYGGRLITFPACRQRDPGFGVDYVYVEDGVYENRMNRREAEQCVELIARHIEEYPDRSLGVIAFSERQQAAIEEAVHQYRLDHPEQESFFSEQREEPFFIKNLENVQGDERDTIIFSICYGKNAAGRMYLRFGPLGQQGGERRLNVAVTRARCRIRLIGSILPSDIDLGRTNAAGVRLLRSYIDFAMNGIPADAEEEQNRDPFCRAVADFLERSGYRVSHRIGASSYRIDLAVEDPDHPGRWLAGLECDGESYRKARTVRDRDHLRPEVLRKMGWKIYRLWSAAWLRNPEGEQQRLLEFLRKEQILCQERQD